MSQTTIQPPALTGQDIAEAQGALRNVLDRVLRDHGTTSDEYVTMRVITVRGPWAGRVDLAGYLAGQSQLNLGIDAAGALLDGLAERGVISVTRPVTLTAEGARLFARLGAATRTGSAGLYAGFDPADLETAHRVLVEITERANALSLPS
jgi:hypothetical protein